MKHLLLLFSRFCSYKQMWFFHYLQEVNSRNPHYEINNTFKHYIMAKVCQIYRYPLNNRAHLPTIWEQHPGLHVFLEFLLPSIVNCFIKTFLYIFFLYHRILCNNLLLEESLDKTRQSVLMFSMIYRWFDPYSLSIKVEAWQI